MYCFNKMMEIVKNKKSNTAEFIAKAIEKHGNLYNYSKVEYKGCDLNVNIICKTHGDFLQTPYNHLKGQGCRLCGFTKTRKGNTAEFIERSKLKHGDLFDYSKVEYKNSNEKVIIICKTHGNFLQTPSHHLNRGNVCCPKCRGRNKTTEEFIVEAREKHGDLYDYSKTIYNKAHEKIIIVCKIHGDFLQQANLHLMGCGCTMCGIEKNGNTMKSNTAEFVNKSQEKHGDLYDYSKVEYEKANKKVIIICKIHGEFQQTPNSHLGGAGCPKCVGRNKNNDEFILEAQETHGNLYDYSKTNYDGSKNQITIICKIHGEFQQLPNNHLKGCGCPICGSILTGNKTRSNTAEFLEKAKGIHGDLYNYSKVEYNGANEKVVIVCKIHGEFQQAASAHLTGQGCPTCGFISTGGKLRSNTTEFIERAILKHGDLYNYSKVEYNNNCENKVIIICKLHGEFLQAPIRHLQGNGCNLCGNIAIGDKKRSNTAEFLEKVKGIHGDLYDYSKVEYKHAHEKITIICKLHGEFQQGASAHLSGQGCSLCGDISTANYQRSNTAEFLEKATEIHGDLYDYSKVEYKHAHDKVAIICKLHGEFLQAPTKHLCGNGCTLCGIISTGDKLRSNTEEFIEKAQIKHGDLYDYSKVDYVKLINKVVIICKIHGEFQQEANAHLQGHGCSLCSSILIGNNFRSNTAEFIEKAQKKHESLYDYSKVEYIGNHKKILIICKKHGEFQQTPHNHLSGQGCSNCINKTEGKLYVKLQDVYSSIFQQFTADWCKYKKFDFCIPDLKIIIELDGKQHFQQIMNWLSPEVQFERDKYKEKCANDNGYSIIRLLQEDVFYDTYDWFDELCSSIEKIKLENKITNIYLSTGNEYEHY